ncbi:MAG: glycosyltransferase [Bacteroidales bacterium]|nr:glycosyltransferase [Bacteroidales bacterium]
MPEKGVKRVLILTYYWPPSGGAGVQRWLKFVKYLPSAGWQPLVYTPLNPEIPYRDESLLADIPEEAEILKNRIFEPYQLYNIFTGKAKDSKFQHGMLREHEQGKTSLKERAALWIRGNLFIPDARAFWIRPSVRFLIEYLRKHPVDLMISSGPPHSLHLIARDIRRKTGLPWVADFRDPWTGIYYFDQLLPGKIARKKHYRLEQSCLDEADQLITVGRTMKNDFAKRTGTPITVISNGFDESDFGNAREAASKIFRIFYSGMFLPDQNPPELWEALGELVREYPDFAASLELEFTGRTDMSIRQSIDKNGLTPFLKLNDYIPHAQLPARQQQAALLLLSINRIENAGYILTGKVFEYLAAHRPILAICPQNSDVGEIIQETKSGYTVEFGQKERMKTLILQLFQEHQNGNLTLSQQQTESYTRKNLTIKLVSLLNQCLSERKR